MAALRSPCLVKDSQHLADGQIGIAVERLLDAAEFESALELDGREPRRQPLEIGQEAIFAGQVAQVAQVAMEAVEAVGAGAAMGAGGIEAVRAIPETAPRSRAIMASSVMATSVMASSISFAAASSTVMNSMVTMSYYRSSFVDPHVIDAGLIMVLALLTVGIFVEATGFAPSPSNRMALRVVAVAQRLRIALIALYVIFGGLVIARLALLFGAL